MLRHLLFHVDDHRVAERFSVGFRISAAGIVACVVPHLLVRIEHDLGISLTRRLGLCGRKHPAANAGALYIFGDTDLIVADGGIVVGDHRPR